MRPVSVHWWKLSLAVGLTAFGYSQALGPVLRSVGQEAAQTARTQRLGARLHALAAKNAAAAAALQADEQHLQATVAEENALRQEIARVLAQTPPPPATVSAASVAVPAVHATSGASGVP